MSGISEVAGSFAQNSADLAAYQDELSAGRLPVVRGHRLSADDEWRRLAITHLMCNLELPFDLGADRFGVRLDEEFAAEFECLEPLAADGLLVREENRLVVTDLGRFFIRNICMELDAYLPEEAGRPLFSRTV
jgi:oxygen-independent coproporphyrinogen-3 oxidase